MNRKLKFSLICLVFIMLASHSLADVKTNGENQSQLIPKNINDLYNLGVNYAFNNEHLKAIEVFKQIIQIDPDRVQAYYYMGISYASLGLHRETIEALKHVKFDPNHPFAFSLHAMLGASYYELKYYKEAIEEFNLAIRIKPDNQTSHFHLGSSYTILGRHKEAKEALKESIRLDPDHALSHYWMGINCGALGLPREAVEELKQAIRIKPDFAEAHYAIGLFYIALSNRENALEQYKILKTLDKEKANMLFDEIYQ